jgi:hypothetical protein
MDLARGRRRTDKPATPARRALSPAVRGAALSRSFRGSIGALRGSGGRERMNSLIVPSCGKCLDPWLGKG